jgi:hypothetical protein
MCKIERGIVLTVTTLNSVILMSVIPVDIFANVASYLTRRVP